eukprot:8270425-Alexandrium_andersonii.AAC.1
MGVSHVLARIGVKARLQGRSLHDGWRAPAQHSRVLPTKSRVTECPERANTYTLELAQGSFASCPR